METFEEEILRGVLSSSLASHGSIWASAEKRIGYRAKEQSRGRRALEDRISGQMREILAEKLASLPLLLLQRERESVCACVCFFFVCVCVGGGCLGFWG